MTEIKDKLILLQILLLMEHVTVELRNIADLTRSIDQATSENFAVWSDQVKDWKERIEQKL